MFVTTPQGQAFVTPMESEPKQPEKIAVDLSKKSVLVIDNGYFLCLAQQLAKDFGTVFYATQWRSNGPTPDKAYPGKGLPGIVWCERWAEVADKVDLICFFDVNDWDIQEMFRRMGKRVFGAGYTENLELDRLYFKQVLEQAKLPGPKYYVVNGIDELRELLKKENDLWVKIDSKWRGIRETWRHDDWDSSETIVDEIAHTLGGVRREFRFIVEKPWKGLEAGNDYFISGGQYLPVGTYGFEDKDEGYICRVEKLPEMPAPVSQVIDGMVPFYQMHGTCGMASTEIRVSDKGEPYFLDATQRAGSPPSEIIGGLYENFSHMIWAIAGGEMIEPKPVSKYAAQVVLKSGMAMCEWLPVSVDQAFEDFVKFHRLCRIGEQDYIIPMHMNEVIGSAVGYGNTKEEAEKNALAAAEAVHCKDLYYNKAVFEELSEVLEEAEKIGLGAF